MTEGQSPQSGFAIPWWPVIVTIAVWAITECLYLFGYQQAPLGTVFDGFVGTTDDQNMYFSFIRQSADGHWLFTNRLTHIPHQPALFNLEWLMVGKLMTLLGGSQRWAYSIWRAIGTAVLIFGFWSLACAALRSQFHRRVALLLCAFGCGFGWVFLILEKAGLTAKWPAAMLDLSDAIYPFGQILINPHLSISHGLSLLFLAAFIVGEKTEQPRWYGFAAAIAVLHGLIRPYDLILLTGVIPLYCLLESVVTRSFSWRKLGLRAVPLIAIAPLVGYYVWLFHYHPVFKYWAGQGAVKEMPLGGHLFSFGAIGLLCAVRLCCFRRYPLNGPADRLLCVWIAGALVLVHANKLPLFSFLPYSPVFGITLITPMVILAVPLSDAIKNRLATRRVRVLVGVFVVLIAINSLGSGVWVLKTVYNLRSFPDHYIATTDAQAFDWLNTHSQESDVVLSTLYTGNRMAKQVSARMVLGHWSVTPHVREMTRTAVDFYAGEMSPTSAKAFLDELDAEWIYVGRDEEQFGTIALEEIPGVTLSYANDEVRIYSYSGAAHDPE
ncbi:hypothetical protein Mal52_37900 [Symmachiella dynata]|uniref:Glycosyltransferase RgtA/B/C/D-like domain-containing protein n=1 Tax=Symmachiella dynata TaxID=2527995 RepID=A0A517ZS39_9PLAN|nr:hypothetical protein [Symmachiella dynata]QDU45297.1 hypothetical protein Mal52_37900 [Symmachiella dynata]